ncbi:hypothetical protein TWF225_002487 [Orbilia oligospora]|uniref:Uncharacterized protein n=1 Tax=Orbilia oligospora TaxID=2813651 RepID=A0A7C8KFY6_ORBOL|nr:hypothetical protein TWF751_008491 [Orbilia oligospora]KAF3189985.1 hypothetical protein TWF225_002487 [Orbilia oligospora]KAF3266273.1 hypothetical protein TWF217_001947 [Orbilia oligospora]KAF3268605.1 hypothetical protein TWF128_006992 [Orbilia oligospora]KAF3297071.1 hypothetical protein TWF132_008435 [Orbilia oligospora]
MQLTSVFAVVAVVLSPLVSAAVYKCPATQYTEYYCCASSGPLTNCVGGSSQVACKAPYQYPACCAGPGYNCIFAPMANTCACPPVYTCPC